MVLKHALDILKNNSPKDKLKVIKLFTDGLQVQNQIVVMEQKLKNILKIIILNV